MSLFFFPSARGINFIFGSKGQERAKFKFVSVSADFAELFLLFKQLLYHVPQTEALGEKEESDN